MSTRSRLSRRSRTIVVVWLMAVSGAIHAPRAVAAPCWFPPIEGTITDAFRAPPCPWCAGNRGLEYRIARNVVVRAAASGRVEFVGSVAGVLYVVVRLASGWRQTYGQLTSTTLESGAVVFSGSAVGRASDRFFFGLRIGDDYADPEPYIGELRGRPRLIPVDGTPARPGGAVQPKCATQLPAGSHDGPRGVRR